jgi:hypothetical protein
MFEEEEFGMRPAPRIVTVPVLLQHHSEFDAGAPVTVVAKLMKADQLSLVRIVGQRRQSGAGQSQGDRNGRKPMLQHCLSPHYAAGRLSGLMKRG